MNTLSKHYTDEEMYKKMHDFLKRFYPKIYDEVVLGAIHYLPLSGGFNPFTGWVEK